jgi:hypothetical protein
MSLDVYLTIEDEEVFGHNITHNLNTMAAEAGIYEALWRPEELGIEKAEQLVNILDKGLTTLKLDRERFEEFNPANGWGNYDNLVNFTEKYLQACRLFPDADVRVSR